MSNENYKPPQNKKLISEFIRKNLLNNAKFFGVDFIPVKRTDIVIDHWEVIKSQADKCKLCSLCETRTRVVYGEGPKDARVMFIGEAPGADEDILGLPFVGRAGKLLDQILQEINWSRNNVYITNIIKCRPPENRQPTPIEISKCSKYLRFQIEYINPKVIVLLGAIAATNILGTFVPRITGMRDIRGNIYENNGKKYLPTYHPAFILRNQKDYLILKEDILKAKKLSSSL